MLRRQEGQWLTILSDDSLSVRAQNEARHELHNVMAEIHSMAVSIRKLEVERTGTRGATASRRAGPTILNTATSRS
jgi:hypothetical protein